MQATHAGTQPISELAKDVTAVAIAAQKSAGPDWFSLVGELELSISQLKSLLTLDRDGEMTLKDLAEHLHLSLPAMSRAVEGLCRRGFVLRREDDDDRRHKRVAITAGGSSVIRRLNEVRLAGITNFLQSLTSTERDDLAAALAPLVARADVAACRPQGPSS